MYAAFFSLIRFDDFIPAGVVIVISLDSFSCFFNARFPPALLQIGDSLFVDLPRVRLDGGAKKFRQRWGYELVNQPAVLLEEDEEADPDDVIDTVSLRETTVTGSGGGGAAANSACAPFNLGESPPPSFFFNTFLHYLLISTYEHACSIT